MPFKAYEISSGETRAVVVPERGALVTELRVGGKEILYLNRETLEDPAKNVRGGIPVLFPYAGLLKDDLLLASGKKMGQHGFGRNSAWSVTEESGEALTVTLESNETTLDVYPFAFSVSHAARALPRGLRIEMAVTNKDDKPLPASPGWHPYFNCPTDEKGKVTGNVDGLTSEPLSQNEFDFGLVAPEDGIARFSIPQLGELTIKFLPEMRHLQFWTQPGKDFICLEPFWGTANTINTEAKAEIAPGSTKIFWMELELE